MHGELFVDTSGWGCYFDESDPFHERAEEFVRLTAEFGAKLITTMDRVCLWEGEPPGEPIIRLGRSLTLPLSAAQESSPPINPIIQYSGL